LIRRQANQLRRIHPSIATAILAADGFFRERSIARAAAPLETQTELFFFLGE